jgi:hypothetical protein
MLYFATYVAACTTLLITFGMARLMPAPEFQHVALGLVAGGFGAVLANLGSDQSHLNALLRAETHVARVRLALHDIRRRIATLALLLALFCIYTTVTTANRPVSIAFFLWAASLGLAPNGYVDYLGQQTRQQFIIVLERIAALGAMLTLTFTTAGRSTFFSLCTALILVSCRAFSLVAQWRAVLQHDADRADGGVLPVPSLRATGTFLPTIAALCNSCTAYIPALLLDVFHQKADLVLYSLTVQATSVVVLFHGAAARVASRIMASDLQSGGHLRAFAIARRVFAISLPIALIAGAGTAIYLASIQPLSPLPRVLWLVAIMFAWAAWLGFGQVITRALMIGGHDGFYAAAAALTTVVSSMAAYALVNSWGAIGTAVSIAVPHALMIAGCALYLKHLSQSQ